MEDPEYNMSDTDSARLKQLEEKVDKLINKIEMIFGSHILIDGRFMIIDCKIGETNGK